MFIYCQLPDFPSFFRFIILKFFYLSLSDSKNFPLHFPYLSHTDTMILIWIEFSSLLSNINVDVTPPKPKSHVCELCDWACWNAVVISQQNLYCAFALNRQLVISSGVLITWADKLKLTRKKVQSAGSSSVNAPTCCCCTLYISCFGSFRRLCYHLGNLTITTDF